MNLAAATTEPPSASWTARLAGARATRRLVNTGFHVHAKHRMKRLAAMDPVEVQKRTLRGLVARARDTRFGRDHGFSAIATVDDFQRRVPVRTYETLWDDYLKANYPVFDDLTWPGRIPYLALTSGTTQGATKYIPVSREMVRSNRKAAQTMVAAHLTARPDSRLFEGRMFFLGGTTQLEEPAPGVRQGDLSGIAAIELSSLLRPYTFPPLDLALESDWDRKLALLAERSLSEPITLVSGVPSWLLMLFQRVLELSGKSTIGEVWPMLEMVVHGGVKFDPYEQAFRDVVGRSDVRLQETYPCSEGFIAYGDPQTGLLRLLVDHGIFYEFVSVSEYDPTAAPKARRWLGDVETGVDYVIVVSTCAGMWAHVIGDTIRFESLDPPLIRFTGRTKYTLSAFGEHLINEEIEAAIAAAASETRTSVRDWHVGPVFTGSLGYHQYVIEFNNRVEEPARFRDLLDEDLLRRNADYAAHRVAGVGMPAPGLILTRPGAFEAWMRRRGKLGGQNKVPRMDGSGALTRDLVAFVRESNLVEADVSPGAPPDS
ncbi:MAG: GH3 auxin-responsive promoter family protein [Paludisphaera borealis]|uniref:GH3 family domain-containing protein n=1 Tax=Paludisphaera borealis TaxID=1387353 RepID=UPI00283DAB64|nr:GH3 auxin-responsive promoter family protein [Paludisphaera borealis]MDR3618110.1 GH3 auxin-responsive promoter family protein [Paludisphaera borealis]